MITKIAVTITNNIYLCGLEINSTLTGGSVTGIDKVVIKRQTYGTNTWDEVYSIDVAQSSDLVFDLVDILVKNNTKYKYSIDLKSGETIIESQIYSEIECSFQGMLVATFDTQYVAELDWSVDYNRKTNVAYVNTLSGRTPYRVSNSNNNYCLGKASGIFMKFENGALKPDYDHSYTNAVVDFLTDGENKILKTEDGLIWLVSIDEEITLPFHDRYVGKNAIQFTWTEIGDVPTTGMVVLS